MKITIDDRDTKRLFANLRTWSPKFAGDVVWDGAIKVKRYIKENIKPHNKTGNLYSSVTISTSPKQYSATVKVDARNQRGSYAKAVEEGGWNPRTERTNRPVRFMARALKRYAAEHGSVVEKRLKKSFPKK